MNATNLYSPIIPQRVIQIDKLYTIHYFENHKNYYFAGERHDFWELIYVDRGELLAYTEYMEEPIHLERGDLILFRPMEFHRTFSNNVSSHNLLVTSFSTSSPGMDYFLNHTRFHIPKEMRHQIGVLLHEARKSFYRESMTRAPLSIQRQPTMDFGSEQILVMMMEWLLIQLIRNEAVPDQAASRLSSSYVDNAITFMKQNLRNRITLDDICKFTGISRSQLQKAFQQKLGTSVMHYLVRLRMEEAKYLICTGEKSFTQIAEEFCYSSVHHFSTQFRKTVGMSPTEYAQSVLSAHVVNDYIPLR